LTHSGAALYSDPFTHFTGVFSPANTLTPMANPKRKQSKRRSANRRAANAFKAPLFSTDTTDGSLYRRHHVNPKTGTYRGRQVLTVEV
jgi:large subunit ribosomal protein L32